MQTVCPNCGAVYDQPQDFCDTCGCCLSDPDFTDPFRAARRAGKQHIPDSPAQEQPRPQTDKAASRPEPSAGKQTPPVRKTPKASGKPANQPKTKKASPLRVFAAVGLLAGAGAAGLWLLNRQQPVQPTPTAHAPVFTLGNGSLWFSEGHIPVQIGSPIALQYADNVNLPQLLAETVQRTPDGARIFFPRSYDNDSQTAMLSFVNLNKPQTVFDIGTLNLSYSLDVIANSPDWSYVKRTDPLDPPYLVLGDHGNAAAFRDTDFGVCRWDAQSGEVTRLTDNTNQAVGYWAVENPKYKDSSAEVWDVCTLEYTPFSGQGSDFYEIWRYAVGADAPETLIDRIWSWDAPQNGAPFLYYHRAEADDTDGVIRQSLLEWIDLRDNQQYRRMRDADSELAFENIMRTFSDGSAELEGYTFSSDSEAEFTHTLLLADQSEMSFSGETVTAAKDAPVVIFREDSDEAHQLMLCDGRGLLGSFTPPLNTEEVPFLRISADGNEIAAERDGLGLWYVKRGDAGELRLGQVSRQQNIQDVWFMPEGPVYATAEGIYWGFDQRITDWNDKAEAVLSEDGTALFFRVNGMLHCFTGGADTLIAEQVTDFLPDGQNVLYIAPGDGVSMLWIGGADTYPTQLYPADSILIKNRESEQE